MAATRPADRPIRRPRQTAPILVSGDFKRAILRFIEDAMTHHAAALTYYSLLSLFPALLFTVAVLGLVGEERLIDEAASYLRQVGAPETTIATVTDGLDSAVSQRGSAIGTLALILAASIWGAAAAFGAAGTALNVVLRVQEGRSIVRRKLSDLASTLAVLVLVTAASLLVFLGGDLASAVFGLLGIGDTAEQVWRLVRWPAALACTFLVYAIVYYSAPDVGARRFKWISPGAITGVALWFLLSGGFFLYVATFARYSFIYGTFTAIVILLVWIWLTNVALLLGAELNAAIDLRRSAAAPQSSVSASAPERADDPEAERSAGAAVPE
ncbi:MAG: YihY/virulence factor BrkB family protein [Solirubrobacterales bacterium]|nr:YihY/virulence factor BrkB family protein [Solirubrobacterales bacterium]